ncbi:MAG: RNA ligase family protein [Planctomycetaceae bacterium]|nr:RNA ligase family protein [Planctomycetaceae bacterium]
MGTSHGNFIKYPRTPHLFGSKGTDDDRHLDEAASVEMLREESLIVEEKLDGTNVGIHFSESGELVLQCRGHLITEGMHPQYDLFKQWAMVKRSVLEEMLAGRFILFGEWMYARHTVEYRALPHYFFEFDIYDKEENRFLPYQERMILLEGTGVQTVPIVHRGGLTRKELESLVQASPFQARFEHPGAARIDDRMEGLYLRTELDRAVLQRAKWVRPEFVEKIKESQHWQYQQMQVNQLADGVDLWA